MGWRRWGGDGPNLQSCASLFPRGLSEGHEAIQCGLTKDAGVLSGGEHWAGEQRRCNLREIDHRVSDSGAASWTRLAIDSQWWEGGGERLVCGSPFLDSKSGSTQTQRTKGEWG